MAERNSHKTYQPRKSLRLKGYDYTQHGTYSITICTPHRNPFLRIPILRSILEEEWQHLPQHFTGITPGILRVMPEHLHCMIQIDGETNGNKSLSDIIGGFKSIVSVKWIQYMKQENIDGPAKIWQRSFNDHIIRNEADLREKEQYIINNPIKHQLKEEQRRSDMLKEEQRRRDMQKKRTP